MADFTDLLASLFPLLLLAVVIHKRWRSGPKKTPPPSPRKLPVIGNLHQLGELPHRSLRSLSKRYGEVMLLHFGKVPVMVASSTAAATEIMKTQDSIFSSRPKLSIAHRLTYGSMDVGFARSGDYWRRVKGICVQQLLSNKMVETYRRVREEETSLMIREIEKLRSSSPVVNLSDVIFSVTSDVVCRVALGRKYGEDRNLRKLLETFVRVLGTFSVGDYVPWLGWMNRINGLDAEVDNVSKRMGAFLGRVIQQHRDGEKEVDGDNGNSTDFVDVLLQIQRESQDTSPIQDFMIKGVIQDIFVAGSLATSTSLEWTVAELIRNPTSMELVQIEVRSAGQGKDEIDEGDVANMPYLKAVIKEGLRLHPPSPLLVPRELIQDTNVLGYNVAGGTQVLVNAWAINRDPSAWDDPEEFRPERFLHTKVDLRGQHFEFIPFGAGRRGCPGISFALGVIELALAKLVRKFNFALPHGKRAEDLDMTEASAFTVHKKSPLLVIATSAA